MSLYTIFVKILARIANKIKKIGWDFMWSRGGIKETTWLAGKIFRKLKDDKVVGHLVFKNISLVAK